MSSCVGGCQTLASCFLGLTEVEHFLPLVNASVETSSHVCGTVPPAGSLMKDDEPLFPLVPNGSFLNLCGSGFISSLFVLKSLLRLCGHLRLD